MQPAENQGFTAIKSCTIDLESVKRVYRFYAGFYDLVFGGVFEVGRRAAVEMVNGMGKKRILEVGVGTGLSLPRYHPEQRVTGVDICGEMLAKAHERVAALGLRQVESLFEMDAQDLAFPANSFDVVVAMFVVSVAPDPKHLLTEMKRVCVPGGDIVVVNHFASRNGLARLVEHAIAPLSARIGFRPDFELESLTRMNGLELIEVRNTNRLGFNKLIHFRKPTGQPAAFAHPPAHLAEVGAASRAESGLAG